jgi:hypothetical protein
MANYPKRTSMSRIFSRIEMVWLLRPLTRLCGAHFQDHELIRIHTGDPSRAAALATITAPAPGNSKRQRHVEMTL